MSSWLDRLAKRAAHEASPVSLPTTEAPAASPSRRDFMKKAGIVGAAAWSVPVLQTALAPAASASVPSCVNVCGGTCPKCSAGGSVCTSNAGCFSDICSGGVCQKAGAGGTCAGNTDCLSGSCSAGFCQGGGIGTTCVVQGDCAAGQCSQRTGGPRTCGGPGSTCANDAGCTYGNCNGSVCGGNGAVCLVVGQNERCANGFTCTQPGASPIRCR